MKSVIKTTFLLISVFAALGACISFEAGVSIPGASRSLGQIEVGNNDTVRLGAGTYEGRLVVEANNATIVGAGVGNTILRGDVIIQGNSNTIRGVTIVGSVSISGNTNDLSRSDVSRATVSSSGNNNRY